MNSLLRSDVINALVDYKYLLNRGYPQKPSLDFVTSRYGLSNVERVLLLRCIHSDLDVTEISRKMIPESEVGNYELVIDGFNVLITLASVIEGDYVYLCDDGIVRDLRSSKFKDVSIEILKEALNKLVKYVNFLGPRQTIIVLDKNVSRSGELRNSIKDVFNNAKVVLASKADIAVISTDALTSSSDFVILKKVSRIFDIAGYIIMNEFKDRMIDINELIREGLKNLNLTTD